MVTSIVIVVFFQIRGRDSTLTKKKSYLNMLFIYLNEEAPDSSLNLVVTMKSFSLIFSRTEAIHD